ncbi:MULTISPECIES: DUF305 domain-containing protein [unclassified Frankia]|uniref:DUF305 domain-containing protein n=2 Tax=Frankia TaxID=1854 RepID=UPI001EF5FBBF|nr:MULTISPECIES: DUF305 domain-containing protein [unclassified Frankia]
MASGDRTSDGSGPGDSDGDSGGDADRTVRLRRASRWVPLALALVVALLAAGAGLRGIIDRPPGDGSVDAGFARDMSAHHAQAVQMAMVEFRGGADATQRGVAADVALTQQREIGIMSAWLTQWGLPQVSTDPPMRWMRSVHLDHDSSGHGGAATDAVRMPGMATSTELSQLAGASGRELDALFLTLMIRHHRGGITMAQEAAARAEEPDVRALARAMVINQAAEIEQMQADLRAMGVPPA